MTTSVPLIARVAPSEQAVIAATRDHLARSLNAADGGDWSFDCVFVETADGLRDAPTGTIVVTSLLPEVDIDEAWPDTEARLRSLYADLSARGEPVFICTVLRHAGDGDPDTVLSRRVRIRRLNRLTAELSREYGAFVIDIDRVLADVGARRLDTDYRLDGATAADLAGKAMATDIIVNGLDAFATFDVQDAAKASLSQHQTLVALPAEIKPQNLMALGQGRRKQIVATITDTDQQGHVGWLIDQALKGKIAPAEAFGKLVQAMRRRGAKESLGMLANALLKRGKRT